mgnify:CR=1 FL=1
MDTERIRREGLRWYSLLALGNARPMDLCEEVVQATLRAIYPDATALEIRRELDSLAGRRLVELRKEPSGRWWAKLSRDGVDVVEYTVDCDPGIGRPIKYWST